MSSSAGAVEPVRGERILSRLRGRGDVPMTVSTTGDEIRLWQQSTPTHHPADVVLPAEAWDELDEDERCVRVASGGVVFDVVVTVRDAVGPTIVSARPPSAQ